LAEIGVIGPLLARIAIKQKAQILRQAGAGIQIKFQRESSRDAPYILA
jgi:hypothetical protein